MKKRFDQIGPKTLIRKEAGSLVQQEEIKGLIKILPEFEALIPPLLSEEYAQLALNVQKEGCREPLLIWHTTQATLDGSDDLSPAYVLIDGHNRYAICQTFHLDFKILLREFPGKENVRDFMIDNQLGRRNLTPEQTAYLRGLRYLQTKRQTGRPASSTEHELVDSPPAIDLTTDSPKTANRTETTLAKQFNVSAKTIRLDASYAKGLDKLAEPLKKQVLSRQVKLGKGLLIRLGDLPQPVPPVESVDQLNRLLAEPPTPNGEPYTQPVIPEKTQEHITQVLQLAANLNDPDADIRATCLQLIDQLQRIVSRMDQ
ncbi:ParB N-terminal domain-containing protein [Spirosoma agri]|uniref:ParB N-terminal domain-containing protein n=1 Tax=Spirosoma agri TaxID=1987381 RepID=A0A6M0IS45_9BACT|nr:hypothetical protein [Spirosoma agri]NEU70832.1 hypothetical protein [Spirosoma agri]